jgi:hypothetical protein
MYPPSLYYYPNAKKRFRSFFVLIRPAPLLRLVLLRLGELTVPSQLCGDERLSNSFRRFMACIAWREL